ncbi:MAG TPA: choice-of-anchor tandem repeat GloVer-containing protein [Candidatus Nitrosotalea sp.]|nr:choice-of-anchor tandem repeat GloVer-containing protein [Candidatus Nitrosotalea sp.]
MLNSRTSACCVALIVLAGCGGQSKLALPPVGSAVREAAPSHHGPRRHERVLYSFNGNADGGDPAADLVFDPSGNLYGTTVVGGAANCGTVFELTPRARPPWQESVRYNFTCYSDGKNPYGGVFLDSQENAFGTTVSGGSGPSCGSTGCGVAFELSGSNERVLHDFTGGSDGFGPGGGLAADAHGNLFGTTPDGGAYGAGTVYELYRHGTTWKERVLHAFTGGTDGATGSLGRLVVDNAGSVYGVTEVGGANSAGTVYRLTPSKGGFTFATLYAFKGAPDCASPYGGLSYDAGGGDLYGTTYYGGSSGAGCIFRLDAARKYAEYILYSFKGGSDGSNPTSTLATLGKCCFDFYGTTSTGGGSCDCGTIFHLHRTAKAPASETVVHAFGGAGDGAYPYYGMKYSNGNLYGTTAAGGNANQGTVFEFGQ